MVAYAVYLVYRSERLKKVLEAGADTIKYQKLLSLFSHLIFCLRTLSNLNLKPGSSLVALGHSVRRKTMDRLSSNVGGSIRWEGGEERDTLPEEMEEESRSKLCFRRDKEEGEYLVNDEEMSPGVWQ